jgi:hypothetical protein
MSKASRTKVGKRPSLGRPPRSEAGRREQIAVRVSPEVKQLLEQAARRNRHSVTAEVESRLATSLSVGRQAHIAALMAAVGKLAAALERRTQKRWIADAFTARALSVGVEQLLFHFGRSGKPVLPLTIKEALAKMPPEEKERFSAPKGWGEFEAGHLIALIEGAQEPVPGMTPEIGPWGWGHYELLRALGSGWQRNRAAWSLGFLKTKGGAS